jgi:ribonuclease HI
MADMRNVSGEIYGSMAAMKWCLDNGVTDVVIYYDYEGIAKWALHEWKANKKGTQAYAAYYDSIKSKLNVEFRKVKGHSGDKYNDMVDGLAKGALFYS